MPQATSAIFARLPDRRRWFTLRLTSAIRGVRIASRRSFPADPPPGSPLDVPGGALRVRPRDLLRRSGSHSDPCGSSWVPRVRFTLQCPGRSSGPSRVDHVDCLERGETYRRPRWRSTSRSRRSESECAGRGHGRKSDKRKVRSVVPMTSQIGGGCRGLETIARHRHHDTVDPRTALPRSLR